MRHALVLVLALGCAPRATVDVASPSEIARLEQVVAQDATDQSARVTLALAYRQTGRTAEAETLLEEVTATSTEPGPFLLLGLTREELSDWAGAREAYDRYLALGRSTDVKATVERRLQYVRRKEVEAQVKLLAEQEAQFAARPPEPRTVAVFPFLYQGSDSTMRPLGRALAEMLVTDLSVTERVRVLERLQVQLLLDELELGASAYVEPSSAARSGRLLRAAKVVQGSVNGDASRLELGASVIALDQGAQPGRPVPVRQADALTRLFDLEKRLALSLHEALGVQLTVAERERLEQRPTQNLQALLAFGLGLEAEDRGDFAEARQHYTEALRHDPSFVPAGQRAEAAASLGEAAGTQVAVLVERGVEGEQVQLAEADPGGGGDGGGGTGTATNTGVGAPDPAGAAGVRFGPGSVLDGMGGLRDPIHRDAGAEVLGTEGLGARAVLRILFIRPVS